MRALVLRYSGVRERKDRLGADRQFGSSMNVAEFAGSSPVHSAERIGMLGPEVDDLVSPAAWRPSYCSFTRSKSEASSSRQD